MNEEDKFVQILEELLTRFLGKATDEWKELIKIRVILTKILLNMIKLNAAMSKLNYISGTAPTITNEEIENEMSALDKYITEIESLNSRLSIPALNFKSNGKGKG